MLYIIWIFRIEKPTFLNIKNVKYLFFIKNFFYSFFVLYLMKKIKSIFWNTIVFWYCFSFCVSFSDTFLYRFFSIPFSSLDNFLCFLLCFFFTTFLIVTISMLFLAGVSYFVINVVIIRFYYEKKILKFLISYNDPLFQIKSELLSKTNSKINFF